MIGREPPHGRGEFNPSIHDGLRHVGWNLIAERGSQSLAAGYVNRARTSDRLPNFKSVLPEPALLPYCEPVASPFADPILGPIVGPRIVCQRLSRPLLPPVQPGVGTNDAAPGAHHARPERWHRPHAVGALDVSCSLCHHRAILSADPWSHDVTHVAERHGGPA
jgi:hypothetical protein